MEIFNLDLFAEHTLLHELRLSVSVLRQYKLMKR